MDIQKAKIRNVIEGIYDIQKLRIATGNRIVISMRPQFLIEEDANKNTDDNSNQKNKDVILSKIRKEYSQINRYNTQKYDGKVTVRKILSEIGPLDFIRSPVDYTLVENYEHLVDAEAGLVKVINSMVREHPMWNAFFSDVKGCGPVMAGVCIAYLDPYKARHCSSFWKYCGLDVVVDNDGNGHGRAKWHTVTRTYTSKDGSKGEKKSLTYNPFVKSKLLGVLAGSFIKVGPSSHYENVYRDYKHRMEQRDPDIAPIVRHKRAARYAIKMFLRDMWIVWRNIEGLEVTEPYEVAKLGMSPHKGTKAEMQQ